MKSLYITFENRTFKIMKELKDEAEEQLGKRISWATFISGAVIYGS